MYAYSINNSFGMNHTNVLPLPTYRFQQLHLVIKFMSHVEFPLCWFYPPSTLYICRWVVWPSSWSILQPSCLILMTNNIISRWYPGSDHTLITVSRCRRLSPLRYGNRSKCALIVRLVRVKHKHAYKFWGKMGENMVGAVNSRRWHHLITFSTYKGFTYARISSVA
jgi:hypothetical protein